MHRVVNRLAGRRAGRLVALVALAAFLAAGLAACETVKGVGKDVQNAGEAVEDAAQND